MLTLDQLKQITKNQKPEALEKFIQPLNNLFQQFEINTQLRVCFYLANCLHECGEFRWLKELASGKNYEFRKDLGNLQSGDGVKYVGRGVIALTGRINYQKLSNYFGVDFIKNPQLLETPKWAVLSSGFYWKNTNLNKWCDLGDFLQTVYRINGGFNGLQDRLKYLKKSLQVLYPPFSVKYVSETLDKIESNLNAPKDNRFKRMLHKAVPDRVAFDKLVNFLDSV